jgi:hypothetical protein
MVNALFLAALAAQGYAPDALTDALVHDVLGLQRLNGSWIAARSRPPIQSSEFAETAWAIRAIEHYASPGRRAEVTARVARAREWLLAHEPDDTQEAAMRLLGLVWSGAPRPKILDAARTLTGMQQPDGGWNQRPGFRTDAYATGQALFALSEAQPDSTATLSYRRGVAFLLTTQHDDGSWFVRSRAVKLQPYFESGFPYGHDQWISAAATSWAALALTNAVEVAHLRAGRD